MEPLCSLFPSNTHSERAGQIKRRIGWGWGWAGVAAAAAVVFVCCFCLSCQGRFARHVAEEGADTYHDHIQTAHGRTRPQKTRPDRTKPYKTAADTPDRSRGPRPSLPAPHARRAGSANSRRAPRRARAKPRPSGCCEVSLFKNNKNTHTYIPGNLQNKSCHHSLWHRVKITWCHVFRNLDDCVRPVSPMCKFPFFRDCPNHFGA